MNFIDLYTTAGLVILALMTVLWLVSLLLRNSSIVDIFWGAGFVFAAWTCFALTPSGAEARRLAIAILTSLWGLRLTLHILRRNWGKPEDFRYQKWREESGANWWWFSFFKVFFLQGVLMWVISAPLLAAQISPQPASLGVLDLIGLLLWAIGFFFETVGDSELSRFINNPANKGKVMRYGLWRYTRHPNYFGDSTQWWGFYLFALAAGGWWTVFSPILMTFLLVKVSGVALLDKAMAKRKPGYLEYMQTTSSFFPWPPKR
jgi:steroid 5-alpha reductase family enzyme